MSDRIDGAARPAYTLHHRDDPDTSITAAELHPLARTGIRRRVAEILAANPYGLTDDEIHDRGTGTRHRHSTATRRGELAKAGLVVDSGRRRPNIDGNLEVVWLWVGDGHQLDMFGGAG